MCLLDRWKLGNCLSSEWRNAIPRETSNAKRIACAVSTTIPLGRPPWCNTPYSEPFIINWLITIKLGGSLQHPMTGNTLGWEKIRRRGNSSLKSREIRAVHWRTARIFATMSLPCHVPRHDSPDGVTASFFTNDNSWMLMPLWRDSVASPNNKF